jgi:hypothetical protein
VYSPYERETIEEALQIFGAKREPYPEGKVIERVEIVPYDVIENRDLGVVVAAVDGLARLFDVDSVRVRGGIRRAIDMFHTTSRHHVIAREVLLREGEAYRQQAMDDTIRNLRVLPQLSLVVVVPIQGSSPDRVGIIVVTKDVWSLRPNWGFELSSGGVDELSAQPAETNVAGLHHTAYLNLDLLPESFTFGAGYYIPRLGGTRVQLYSQANLITNRETGSLEGTYGYLSTGQTLFSARTEWSWDATVVWTDAILRSYENAQVAQYPIAVTATSKCPCVPFEYRANAYQTGYEATRSFGWDTKHDFTVGGGVNRSVYTTDFAGYDPTVAAEFVQKEVPVGDTRVGPWITYHTYEKRYLRVFDFETLALQEDYRLGHDVYLRVYPTPKAFGSTRDVVGLYGAAMYTVPLRDGLVRVAVQGLADVGPSNVPDSSVATSARIVSPTILGIGRLVVDGYMLYRFSNFLNANSFLGGDSRLRGYPTNFTSGADLVSYNVEFRTRPVDLFTFHLAGVLFYDVGDAFTPLPTGGPWAGFVPLQSAGFGLRGMLPQIDRVVYRFDVGFPLGEGRSIPGILPVSLLFTLGQAFDVPNTTTLGGHTISGNPLGIIGVTPVLPTLQ